ncbi:MAG: hypothetical protein KAG94_05680 [Clostridiales bacterium]|nr:hypothetical protein [Clostridiales bacterium]
MLHITTNNEKVNKAINIAYSDIQSNIITYDSLFLQKKCKVLIAGADYDRPWTRDAAINVYNILCFIDKSISYQTLATVLEYQKNNIVISGQYWDAIIWALGAYQYYLVSKDDTFLPIAYEAICNTLTLRENEEFSKDYGLFRGAAVYGDGSSAYPYIYGYMGKEGSILKFPKHVKERCYDSGYGIPMHTLSTNSTYVMAYDIVSKMAIILSKETAQFKKKKANLIKAIKKHFVYGNHQLKYIVGKYGDSLHQEGLGIALALKADIINAKVLNNIYISPKGLPCVYPKFERYKGEKHYGRHSGTIWPHVQCFFANEAIKADHVKLFIHEFEQLTLVANRDDQFYEVYHPETGLPYGGLQEHYSVEGLKEFNSCEHQSWSATGYLSLLIYGFAGMKITHDYVSFSPYLYDKVSKIKLSNIIIGQCDFDVTIIGEGSKMISIKINGEKKKETKIKINKKQKIVVLITVEKE